MAQPAVGVTAQDVESLACDDSVSAVLLGERQVRMAGAWEAQADDPGDISGFPFLAVGPRGLSPPALWGCGAPADMLIVEG